MGESDGLEIVSASEYERGYGARRDPSPLSIEFGHGLGPFRFHRRPALAR